MDVQKGWFILRFSDKELTINMFRAFRFQNELDSCMQIIIIKESVSETFRFDHPHEPLEACLVHSHDFPREKKEAEECARYMAVIPPIFK